MNENDNYIRQIVAQHTPNITYVAQDKINELRPHIHAWANGHAYILKLSGSLAKGTGITGTTDIDLFISLDPSVSTCNTLENVYNTLRNRFNGAGYTAREQNVSVGINHTGLKMDIVAGVKHHMLGLDHSIWKRKAQTWTKTNIDEHIKHVKNSGRVFDIKAVKIWRKLRNLDFPSFYLELSVMEALKGTSLLGFSPSENFVKVMNYLANDFMDKTILDPANQSNEVSDELTDAEKTKVKDAAVATLQGAWNQAIW
ncbi:nucleotidyltransferase [Candidatus Microgenomates bacterium]|nr:nucleotidyltransferase [Candidatus Microgenomates bacterium]